MKKISTQTDPHKDANFRWLYFGEDRIGQLYIDKKRKHYFVSMFGKERTYPFNAIKTLQSDILSDYILLARSLAHSIGESRLNSDGIDEHLYKKLERPTGLKNTRLISLKDAY